MYERGDVVLVPFPFTDLSATRTRPAVVVSVNAFVEKPPSIQYHYTYVGGHQWNSAASQWEQFTFTCDQPLIAGLWCPGNARKQLNYAQPYFIAYTCSYINNQWKCGCRDQGCTAGFWQLQKFQ